MKDYLDILVNEIHSVVVATVDEKGLPSTRVIDMMLHDGEAVYFLTAKGKNFYVQLLNKSYISLSGMTNGPGTMAKKAISISGAVRKVGAEKLDEIFKQNAYMADIYPTSEQRKALEVFCLYKGRGEYFDLSTKPITRASFMLGEIKAEKRGYRITDNCTACGKCVPVCPTDCIIVGKSYRIAQEHCLHCGNCLSVCEDNAVVKI